MHFKKKNFWLTFILCFSLLFNPLIVQVALYAQDAGADDVINTSEAETERGSQEVDNAYDILQDTDKADTNWLMSDGDKENVRKANQSLDNARDEDRKSVV